jgi:arginine decarboxylase
LVQLKQQTYARYIQERFDRASEGSLTDFISRKQGHLYLDDHINLNQLVHRYGTPLEVMYYPQITRQIERMQTWAKKARKKTQYAGDFLYAYATKANFTAEVVQTALAAGAHYETSASADVEVARHLWHQGVLKPDRLVCCNGSKEPVYLDGIRRLRQDGCTQVVSIVDDLDELDALMPFPLPMLFGVRERAAGNRDGTHLGNDRFGLTPGEVEQVIDRLDGSHHQLVLYHAMVGTQIENSDHFLAMLQDSIESYCRLRQTIPTLRYFNFGGGMPVSGYRMDFSFDYKRFLTRLMQQIRDTCAAYDVPVPHLMGEFGRYTVANHSLYLFEVGKVKPGAKKHDPTWYLVNGSLMVSAPDLALVDNQQFIVLPLDGWDAPVQPVRLAGRRTCDSDDIYPQHPFDPLMLPATGKGLVVGVFGVGAYQKMLSGLGGVHHCLNPEPQKVAIKEQDGHYLFQSVPQQDQAAMMRLLGYQPERMVKPVPPPMGRRLAS